jgi:hypothetical protein
MTYFLLIIVFLIVVVLIYETLAAVARFAGVM